MAFDHGGARRKFTLSALRGLADPRRLSTATLEQTWWLHDMPERPMQLQSRVQVLLAPFILSDNGQRSLGKHCCELLSCAALLEGLQSAAYVTWQSIAEEPLCSMSAIRQS